ncbi:MAG: mechanosensitive ion channel [Clostridiales bacterium]|nr:mechanosensitive ion channel [Clostridiales bacterium]
MELFITKYLLSLTTTTDLSEFDIKENLKGEAQQVTTMFSSINEKLKSMLPSILFALIVFVIGMLLSKILINLLLKTLKRTNVDKTARGFLKSLIKIVLYTLIGVITLSLLNVPMTSIVTIIGAAGLAIGLALQGSLSNLAGGFIILFAQPFKSGDYIETPDASGTVESISILYTKLITPDNNTIYVPNGNVSSGKIINYTQRPTRRLSLEFSFNSDCDIKKIKKILVEIISSHEKILKDPEPFIKVGRNAGNKITIYTRVWTLTEDYWDVNFDMFELTTEAFDRHDIKTSQNHYDISMR